MTVDDSAINDRFCEAIWSVWGQLRNAAEWIARTVAGDPRAAQNWLYRKNAPSLAKALRLMAENDAFRREVDKLIDELREENAKAARGAGAEARTVLPAAGGAICPRLAAAGGLVPGPGGSLALNGIGDRAERDVTRSAGNGPGGGGEDDHVQ